MRLDAGTASDRATQGGLWPLGAADQMNSYPRSRPVYGPAALQPNMETPTRWSPFGMFVPRPYQGGYDELHGRLMHVAQADTYDSSTNPANPNGTYDVPNAWHAVIPLIRLQPHTSAHPGMNNPTGPGPVMIFHAPPSFGIQTRPILATGV